MKAPDPGDIIVPILQCLEIIGHQLYQFDLVNFALIMLDYNFLLELGHPPD
jgi:hypothetical protein